MDKVFDASVWLGQDMDLKRTCDGVQQAEPYLPC